MPSTLTLTNGNVVTLVQDLATFRTYVRTVRDGVEIAYVDVGSTSRTLGDGSQIATAYDLQLSDTGGFTLLATRDLTSPPGSPPVSYAHYVQTEIFNTVGLVDTITPERSGDRSQLVMLPGGGYLVTGMDRPATAPDGDATDYPSWGEFYDRFGNLVGSRFALAWPAQTAVTVNANGSVAAAGFVETYTEFAVGLIAPAGGGTLVGGTGLDYLHGQGGNDTLSGGAGNDVLVGEAGNDVLVGNAGNDIMLGGIGNDLYGVEDDGDLVVELAGEGTDTVQTTLSRYTLSANVENLYLLTNNAVGYGNGLANNLLLAGTGGSLYGGDGNDVLNANLGTNILDGGAGADVMAGGDGDDYYIVDDAGDVISEYNNRGYDTAYVYANYNLLANSSVEVIYLLGAAQNVTGSYGDNSIVGNGLSNMLSGIDGNDYLQGLGGDDTLLGGEGNDLLDGGIGADTMTGGRGNDTYFVDDVGDVVIEIAGSGQGYDTIYSSRSITLATDNSIEIVYLTGSAIAFTGNNLNDHGVGNAEDNVMIGNDGNDYLEGGAGNDNLSGGAGTDLLDGGIGADTMAGGAGNDTYYVNEAGDVIIEAAGGGYDTIYANGNVVLPGSSEVELIIAFNNNTGIQITGSDTANIIKGTLAADILRGGGGDDVITSYAGNDEMYGGDGNDVLYGEQAASSGGGNDLMVGGAGNDRYSVVMDGDVVVEAAGGGYDSAQVGGTYTFTADCEIEYIQWTATFSSDVLTATDNANVIRASQGFVFGLGGDDIIYGGQIGMIGGDGNDFLQGLSASAAVGGNGADTFFIQQNQFNINDFSSAEGDKIQLNSDILRRPVGSLANAGVDFFLATSATGTGAQVYYDQGAGKLWYDSDGTGSSASVLMATLANNATLTASDISFGLAYSQANVVFIV